MSVIDDDEEILTTERGGDGAGETAVRACLGDVVRFQSRKNDDGSWCDGATAE